MTPGGRWDVGWYSRSGRGCHLFSGCGMPWAPGLPGIRMGSRVFTIGSFQLHQKGRCLLSDLGRVVVR